MTRLAVTKKQYYSRMNRLIDAGLVMRINGNYLLSSLGKVVYRSHISIAHAIENYWKLKTIDSIEAPHADGHLPVEEKRRIIEALIERNDIKSILLNQNITTPTTSELTVIDKGFQFSTQLHAFAVCEGFFMTADKACGLERISCPA